MELDRQSPMNGRRGSRYHCIDPTDQPLAIEPLRSQYEMERRPHRTRPPKKPRFIDELVANRHSVIPALARPSQTLDPITPPTGKDVRQNQIRRRTAYPVRNGVGMAGVKNTVLQFNKGD